MMNNEHPNQQISFKFGEQVDCKSKLGKWLNAEVIESTPTQINVHYTGFHKKFDSWVPNNPEWILKQWRRGRSFHINNRIDVLDTFNLWKEAIIIDMNSSEICVHFKKPGSIQGEWINKNSKRILEVGRKSTAYGIGKKQTKNSVRYTHRPIQTEIRVPIYEKEKEALFSRELSSINLLIIDVEGDGNCLFRSVSHQLYGDTAFHMTIRRVIVEYLSIEKAYFEEFMFGQEFEEYLAHESRNGAWGGDIEIEAMSEFYCRSFEIYAYSKTPLKTFHENQGLGIPIRLSYHGKSHFNSIVSKNIYEPILSSKPGEFEETRIEESRKDHINEEIHTARHLFTSFEYFDIEKALKESLGGKQERLIKETADEFERKEDEDAILQQVIEESMRDDNLETAISMSVNENQISSCIENVMAIGFTYEQAVEAWTAVGDDPDMMINYILSNVN